MADKPKVWYLPVPSHTERVFRAEHFEAMLDEFDVTVNDLDRNLSTEELAAGIAPYDAVVSGWGTPSFSAEALAAAQRLRIVAHSAGSVKHLFPEDLVSEHLLPRGIVVFSANEAIALNVAETTVGLLIMASRRWPDLIYNFRETGRWRAEGVPTNGQYLRGSKLGLVSASKVGREVISLLQGWDVSFLVYDPYLSDEAAAALGVTKVGLNELFEQADHVTVHAPSIPETDGMIGAEQLRLMRDGAALVNTARGSVIDHDALYEEAKTGRIMVALDVTTPEPLPPDSPLRSLPNVYVTPHVAGAGCYGYQKIGETTLQALRDCFAGRPVRGAVDFSHWAQLA